jgi:hypothetical protein
VYSDGHNDSQHSERSKALSVSLIFSKASVVPSEPLVIVYPFRPTIATASARAVNNYIGFLSIWLVAH